MESKMAVAIGAKYEPVAIILTEVKPEGARQFKEGNAKYSWNNFIRLRI